MLQRVKPYWKRFRGPLVGYCLLTLVLVAVVQCNNAGRTEQRLNQVAFRTICLEHYILLEQDPAAGNYPLGCDRVLRILAGE